MPDYIVNPSFRVHEQDGEMVRALRGRMVPGKVSKYAIDFNLNKARHAKYVIQGTKVMLGRDVLWSTATAKGTRVAIMKEIIRTLGPVMRTQPVIRFETKGAQINPVIMNMNKTGYEMKLAVDIAVENAGEVLKKIVHANISLDTYSLADLARMDHPYARRHGTIKIYKK